MGSGPPGGRYRSRTADMRRRGGNMFGKHGVGCLDDTSSKLLPLERDPNSAACVDLIAEDHHMFQCRCRSGKLLANVREETHAEGELSVATSNCCGGWSLNSGQSTFALSTRSASPASPASTFTIAGKPCHSSFCSRTCISCSPAARSRGRCALMMHNCIC